MGKHLFALAAVAWICIACVVLWQYDVVNRKLDADASFMLYAGQQILRGHAPYVGVTIVKLPVSPFVAALGIATGRWFGLDDVLGGRLAFWLCASVSVGAVFLLGAQLVRDLGKKPSSVSGGAVTSPTSQVFAALVGSLAAAFLLSFQTYGIQVAEGPEAKLPMVCAGLVCLVLLAREKFLWAGIAAALAFMAWQPGLIFVLAALLAAGLNPTRRRALAEAGAGIAAPLVLMGLYLAFNGAFASMLRQTFGANANYLGEKKVAAGIFNVVGENISQVWNVSLECSATELPFVYLGYLGMIGGAAWLVYRFWHTRAKLFFWVGLPTLLSGAALFAFSLLDMQKCSDLVPLLPYLALGAAFPFAALISFVATKNVRAALALGVILLIGILVYGTLDAFRGRPQNGLSQQRALANELAAQLQPQDRVQQFGDTVFLVMTRRENATRFVHLGEKQGLGILTAEGMNIEALIQQLQSESPRLITLSRAKNKTWADPLYDWIANHYTLGTAYTATEGGTAKETDVWWRRGE